MFSVSQKRDISDAVQKILRATSHPELPTTGEITFTLQVIGAESWSYADIQNNAAVGNPGVNPHNELMASLPEEEARTLIDIAENLPPMPDPRNTPEEFFSGRWLEAYKKMVKAETEQLRERVQRLEDRDRIKDQLFSELSTAFGVLQNDHHAHEIRITQHENFLTPIIEDNLIQHHSDQIRNLMTAVNQFTGKT